MELLALRLLCNVANASFVLSFLAELSPNVPVILRLSAENAAPFSLYIRFGTPFSVYSRGLSFPPLSPFLSPCQSVSSVSCIHDTSFKLILSPVREGSTCVCGAQCDVLFL